MSNDKTFNEILVETKAKMEAEQQTTEEEAREKREENLRRAAATNYDALHQCFASADINSQEGTERVLNSISTATAVLMGEQPSSISMPAPVTTSNIPFDWDSLNENQKNAMQLIADNRNRFFVKPSGSLGDKKGRELDQAHRVANQPAVTPEEPAQPATSRGNDTDAPALESEPTPAPTPAVMPAKKAVAKKVTALPAPSEASEPAPASEAGSTAEASDDKPKGFLAKAKAASKKAVNALD